MTSLPLEETKFWSLLPQTPNTAEKGEFYLSKPGICSDYLQQRLEGGKNPFLTPLVFNLALRM